MIDLPNGETITDDLLPTQNKNILIGVSEGYIDDAGNLVVIDFWGPGENEVFTRQ